MPSYHALLMSSLLLAAHLVYTPGLMSSFKSLKTCATLEAGLGVLAMQNMTHSDEDLDAKIAARA